MSAPARSRRHLYSRNNRDVTLIISDGLRITEDFFPVKALGLALLMPLHTDWGVYSCQNMGLQQLTGWHHYQETGTVCPTRCPDRGRSSGPAFQCDH